SRCLGNRKQEGNCFVGGKRTLKELFKKFLQSGESKNKKISKKTGYLITIALIGLFLLIIGNLFMGSKDEADIEQPSMSIKESSSSSPTASKSEDDSDSSLSDVNDLEKNYEKDLRDMLENIDHVSNVEVMINLDSTKIKVYEDNHITSQQTTDETDTQGGMRKVEVQSEEHETVLVRQGDKETPILVQTKKPDVRGVIIVAKGVGDVEVKKWVIEAVSRVLDVPTHKVSVMPKE